MINGQGTQEAPQVSPEIPQVPQLVRTRWQGKSAHCHVAQSRPSLGLHARLAHEAPGEEVKALVAGLVALVLATGCGSSSQSGSTRRTLCAAASATCGMVDAYCSMPEADPAPEAGEP
jgi:hypothetical protein